MQEERNVSLLLQLPSELLLMVIEKLQMCDLFNLQLTCKVLYQHSFPYLKEMIIVPDNDGNDHTVASQVEAAWKAIQTNGEHVRHIVILNLNKREALRGATELRHLRSHRLRSFRLYSRHSTYMEPFVTQMLLCQLSKCSTLQRLDVPITVAGIFNLPTSFQGLKYLALSDIPQQWYNHKMLISDMPNLKHLHLQFQRPKPRGAGRAHVWPILDAWVNLYNFPTLSSLILENAVLSSVDPVFAGTAAKMETLSLVGCHLSNAETVFRMMPTVTRLMLICSQSFVKVCTADARVLPRLQIVVFDNRSSGFRGLSRRVGLETISPGKLEAGIDWTDEELEAKVTSMRKMAREIAPPLSRQVKLHRWLCSLVV
ncbi:hypothetical protein Plec18170_009713 [Paecilomyces lecythidis]